MRALAWLLRICVFVLLFALALNNQHEVALKTMFGHEWRAPMIFVVLAAFVLGCAAGVAGMLPSWWHRRQPLARPTAEVARSAATASVPTAFEVSQLDHPPRDGL